MVSSALLSTVTAALVCASSVQSYVLPLQSNPELKGDVAEAQAYRLAGRSLNDVSQGSISVPVYKRGGLHPDITKRDPEQIRAWAFRQAEIMKQKYGTSTANLEKRQTIGLTDVGPDRYV